MSASPAGDIVCGIVDGSVQADIVLRTPEVIAFLDHRPVFKGHVLVSPVAHVDTVDDLPDDLVLPLWTSARAIAGAMRRVLGAQGSFLAINNVVSQSVPHLHLHVIPRSKGDGLRGFFWPRLRYDEGEAADYAQRLRAAL